VTRSFKGCEIITIRNLHLLSRITEPWSEWHNGSGG